MHGGVVGIRMGVGIMYMMCGRRGWWDLRLLFSGSSLVVFADLPFVYVSRNAIVDANSHLITLANLTDRCIFLKPIRQSHLSWSEHSELIGIAGSAKEEHIVSAHSKYH